MSTRRDKGNPTLNDSDPRHYVTDQKESRAGSEWGNAIRGDLIRIIACHESRIKKYLKGKMHRSDLPLEVRKLFNDKEKLGEFVRNLWNSPEYKEKKQLLSNRRSVSQKKAQKSREWKKQERQIREEFLLEYERSKKSEIQSERIPEWLQQEIQQQGGLEQWVENQKRAQPNGSQ